MRLLVAVIVVLVGGLFAITEASASPPASRVLRDARRFVHHAQTVTYDATSAVSVPTGADTLVRHRQVRGATRFPRSTEMEITERSGVHEYRSVTGTAGIWVRAGTPSWVHATDYTAFNAAIAPGAAAAAGALADRLVDASILPALLDGAHWASRHGSAIRHVDVTFDPVVALGSDGAEVSSLAGEIITDAHDHPTSLIAHLHAADAVVDVTYTLRWGAPVVVVPPSATDVVASVG